MSAPRTPPNGAAPVASFILPRQPDTIQQIWEVLSLQFTPTNSTIVIPKVTFDGLTDQGKQYLLNKFMATKGEVAMYAHDVAVDRICLGSVEYFNATHRLLRFGSGLPLIFPSSALSVPINAASDTAPAASTATAPRSVTKANSSAEKIPRPPNAFIIYRKHHHFDVVDENPGLHNNQISVIIGNMWSAESAEVRAEYKQKAEQMKAEHAIMYPNYQYQPRKPSEKKKRTSKKKKAAALEAHQATSYEIAQQYPANETEGDLASMKLGRLNPLGQFDHRTVSLPMTTPKLADVFLNDHVGKHLTHVNAYGDEIGAVMAQGIKPAAITQVTQQQDLALVSRHLSQGQYVDEEDLNLFHELSEAYTNWPDMVTSNTKTNPSNGYFDMDADYGFKDV